jgi:hypothetical protein
VSRAGVVGERLEQQHAVVTIQYDGPDCLANRRNLRGMAVRSLHEDRA